MYTTQVISIESNGLVCACTEIESETEENAVWTARQWLDGQVVGRETRREARVTDGGVGVVFAASAWFPGVHHA